MKRKRLIRPKSALPTHKDRNKIRRRPGWSNPAPLELAISKALALLGEPDECDHCKGTGHIMIPASVSNATEKMFWPVPCKRPGCRPGTIARAVWDARTLAKNSFEKLAQQMGISKKDLYILQERARRTNT